LLALLGENGAGKSTCVKVGATGEIVLGPAPIVTP
jgi:ABC-type sugar transport system ATPase subunit